MLAMPIPKTVKTATTFGAREHSILLACRQGLIDVIAECSISGGAQTVICLDVFLNGLTATDAD